MCSLLVLLAALAQPDALGPGDHTRTLTVGDRKRTYLVHAPPRSTLLGTAGSGISVPNCPPPPRNLNAVT